MKIIITTTILIATLLISLPIQAQGFGMPSGHRMPNVSSKVDNVRVSVQAPRWVAPSIIGDYEKERVVMLDTHNPLLIWMPPVYSGIMVDVTFTYDLKIVMVMPGQAPDQAIDHNPIAFQIKQLTTPQCLLPMTVVNAISADYTYVAQVTTHVYSANTIELENKGKSELLLFCKCTEPPTDVRTEREYNIVQPYTPSYELPE